MGSGDGKRPIDFIRGKNYTHGRRVPNRVKSLFAPRNEFVAFYGNPK